MTVSILHRATGVALSAGFAVLSLWLFYAAFGVEQYGVLMSYMGGVIGKIMLVGWSFSFFFHLGNGVRHFVWDVGRGFEKSTADASAWFVLLFAVTLTAMFWWGRS